MKTFYCIRHGESEANAAGLLAGWMDHGLSEKGWLQSVEMAERLKAYPIDLLVVSDLKRAVETAQAIENALGISMMTTGEMREIHLGAWEGKTFADLDPEDAVVVKWLKQDMDFSYPEGESTTDVLKRSQVFFESLLGRPESHIAIVSHGMTLSTLMAQIVFGDYRLSYGLQIINAGIAILHIDGDFRYFSKLNG